MERRNFFKTVLLTPLFTSLLHASKTNKGDLEIYMIADDPHLFVYSILRELQKRDMIHPHAQSFTFLNSHPQENNLKQILYQRGWRYIHKSNHADLIISFSHLRQKAFPSFTLVREGRIRDIRSKELYSIWKEMVESHKLSSCLTTASFRNRGSDISPGKFVLIYKDGHKVGMIPLEANVTKSFRTKELKITARVKDGKAWISESSCRHKICLHSPPVSLAGERIICVPNHFLLEIQGPHAVDTSIG